MKSVNYNKTGGAFLGSGFSQENFDAFQRLRVSTPTSVHESQFTYNLLSLRFEQKTNGSGATIAHDATNRCALMTFSNTPNGGKAYMQTYEYFQYQPGRSQLVKITFSMGSPVSGVTKFAGLTDLTNGFEFQLTENGAQFVLRSSTDNGTQTVMQSDWNGDRLDGTGISGITADWSKGQLLVLDFQALYAGDVRMGFDIGGRIHICHTFHHANIVTVPYIAYATLPVACGMTCTQTVSTTMRFICSALVTEGGATELSGVPHSVTSSITAASGVDTHVLSIRPKTTFGGFTNRTNFGLYSVSGIVTGSNPVRLQIRVGQAITGTTTFSDVNTSFSAFEYNTAGTLSGSGAFTLESDYIAGSNQSSGTIQNRTTWRAPITLDAAGLHRSNGTLTLVAQGIGGASTCQFALNWREIR